MPHLDLTVPGRKENSSPIPYSEDRLAAWVSSKAGSMPLSVVPGFVTDGPPD
jgi:hypothetical protein